MADKKAQTATIRFDKDKHGGTVRGAVNGQAFEFPVDTDVEVTAAQLEALTQSNSTFTTVKPLDEDADVGSSASSTLEGTAMRLEEPPATPKDEDGNPAPTPELSQRTDEELTQQSQQASKDQAETGEGTPEAQSETGKGDGATTGTPPKPKAPKRSAAK